MSIETEWNPAPDADLALAAEVYAGAGHPEPEKIEQPGQPDPIGTASARRDGELLAWATVYPAEDGAWVETLLASRLTRQLQAEAYDDLPPDDDEVAAYEAIFRTAADKAREGGFGTLRWAGQDTGPAGAAARALGARTVEEIGRIWRAETATWTRPFVVPQVEARPMPDGGVEAGPARIHLDLGGTRAYVNAGEAIEDGGLGAETLSGLIAALIEYLRDEYPRISALTVFEFEDGDDAVIRRALELAGLDVDARAQNFELPL
ncbi:hypothetical protein [Phytomonospora endophytica]|uniref:Uncharacterized protein n=1 Tax=Phytomonospora endophytica TaxID=714109 RepID=A0A841FQG2_9ACTN|nr:hypothetical protein [Phytomonospora endophytica]MBB6038395.1 hypothetical protein [Phytomonospora endophytica]GIG64325.1 hypothetical protein Pen01_06200 [Phytomonospora endophytica]